MPSRLGRGSPLRFHCMSSMATGVRPSAPIHGSTPPPPGGVGSGVSVVVPAYREAENLPELIARLGRVREQERLDLELLIVNDESGDGSTAAVARAGAPWVTLINRTGAR